MAIECSCPQCATRYKLDERFAGKKVRCKKCGSAMQVAAGSDPDGVSLDDLAALEASAAPISAGSVAGRSTSSHGSRHGSRPAPPPPAVIFEREDDIAEREPRKPIWGVSTPVISDQAAGLIATIFLLSTLVLIGYSTKRGYDFYNNHPRITDFFREKLPGVTALGVATTIGGLFLLVVPAFIASAIIGSVADRKNTPPLDLLRAAGVACVPVVVITLFGIFGKDNPEDRIDMHTGLLMLLVSFVVSALAIRELMQYRILPTIVTLVAWVILGTMAMWGTTEVRTRSQKWYVGEPPEPPPMARTSPFVMPPRPMPPIRPGISSAFPVAPAAPRPVQPPPPPPDPYQSKLGNMISRLDERIAQSQGFTREQMTTYWQPQLDDFAALEAKPASPLYVQYAERVSRINAMMAAAPSGEAPPEIFVALADPFELTNAPADAPLLGEPIRHGPLVIQPLKGARIDLSKAGQRATMLSWTLPNQPNTRVTLSLLPHRINKQTRPWLTSNKAVQSLAEGKGFYVLDYPTPLETVVKIDQLTLLRLAPAQPMAPERRVYAGVHDGQFIELTLQHDRPDDKATFSQLEAMARSLRIATTTDATVDPFSIAAVVPRLEDDFANAAPVIEAAGSAAEDAVLVWAKSTGKPPSTEVQGLLRKIGTRKSAAYLAGFAPAPGQPAGGIEPGPAKPAEKPIIPAAVVLEKFELELDQAKKIDMLDSLARQTPGSNRDEVAKLLEGILLAPGNDALLPATGKALAVWYGPNTIEATRKMLEKGVPSPYRQATITALAGTRNAKLVMPIMLCIQEEPETTVAALIAMGPMAELDVIKLLKENDPNIRRNGARVLKEIGTARCLTVLKNATGSGDPIYAEAWEAVVARRRATGK